MVKIVTDSSCDISLERCAELGVELLPITVNFGEESYRANLDITNEEFYEKLATVQELPKTAQITPAQFEKIFQPYKESGDDVVCLFISSKMSGTLQSARVAKNILGADNILLPDTLNVTFALGLLVEEAVKMRDAGMTGAEIVAKIEELIHELKRDYTIVIVTHNMQQAARVSDKTGFFMLGELVEYSDTKKMFLNPEKIQTQNYITGRFG